MVLRERRHQPPELRGNATMGGPPLASIVHEHPREGRVRALLQPDDRVQRAANEQSLEDHLIPCALVEVFGRVGIVMRDGVEDGCDVAAHPLCSPAAKFIREGKEREATVESNGFANVCGGKELLDGGYIAGAIFSRIGEHERGASGLIDAPLMWMPSRPDGLGLGTIVFAEFEVVLAHKSWSPAERDKELPVGSAAGNELSLSADPGKDIRAVSLADPPLEQVDDSREIGLILRSRHHILAYYLEIECEPCIANHLLVLATIVLSIRGHPE